MAHAADPAALTNRIFVGDSAMATLMRTVDWTATPIGPVDNWPQSLQTAVSICLDSRFPILLWWGPDLVMLYNDAYRVLLGTDKHPRAMGQAGRDCWPEIWEIIGPMLHGVLSRGEATWSEDQLLVLERNGYPEECYFTFSYSPIREEGGGIGGVFTAVTETTARVVGERRVRTLRALAAAALEAQDADDACARAAAALAGYTIGIPFALLYLLDAGGAQARLAATSGIETGRPASPLSIDLSDAGADGGWPLAAVLAGHSDGLVSGLRERFGAVPAGPWPDPPQNALVLRLEQAGQAQPAGFLVAALSPRRAVDDDCRGFLILVAGQIATAVADARARAAERQHAEALAELDRAKTAFFSNVSHEFRTPLTLMLGPISDALADVEHPLPRAQRERMILARRNSLRLLKLVNTLLDFSRIEAGRASAAYEPADLAAFTADLASVFRSAVERAGLRLVVDCPPLPEPVYVDRDMWEKIVLNLLSNAVKFTFAGTITVRLRSRGDHAELTVADTGTGILAAELPRLFERFHRVRGARGRSQEGSGIGLAFVHELVRLHGGTIAAASEVGVGTTFTVSFPFGDAHLPADRVAALHSLLPATEGAAGYVEEALHWLPEVAGAPPGSGETGGDAADRAVGAFGGRQPAGRVLVADDNAGMRAYLARLLGSRWTVETAADGGAALDAARAAPPDLVLADVMMPSLDGFALLAALRAEPGTQEVPVVLLSARAGEEARVEGLAAGADDYIVKPFSARELIARVEAHIALARLRAGATRREQELRREAEAARHEVERERERLHNLFMAAPAAICLLQGPDHRYAFANPRYMELVGQRDIIGKPIREALPELAGQGFFRLLDDVYINGGSFAGNDVPVRLNRTGSGMVEGFFNFVYQATRDAAGGIDGVVVHAVEVTGQVRARQQVEDLLARLQLAQDAAHIGSFWWDIGADRIEWTPELEALYGLSAGGFGGTYAGWRCWVHPDDIAQAEAAIQRSFLSGELDASWRVVWPDGSVRWLAARARVERDAAGEPARMIGVNWDVTERVRLEQEREAALQQAREALAARDQFLASVSHDLRTPLTSIGGLTQLAQRQVGRLQGPAAERLTAHLRRIESASAKMAGMVSDLLDLSLHASGRALPLQRRQANLVPLLTGWVNEAQQDHPNRAIDVETRVASLTGEWDTGRIGRVVANLLSNAVKYSPNGAPVHLTLDREERDGRAYAVLTVTDVGMGIRAADLPHVFERFYRGSNVVGQVSGTGIGLAGVKQIVEQHGGTVAVASVEGAGSTFTVQLPLDAEAAPLPQPLP